MGSARFEPRGFTSEPHLFGDRLEIEWPDIPETDLEMHRARYAARLQHEFVVALRKRLGEIGWSVPVYARRIGAKPGRLGRLLRGEIVAQTVDFAVAAVLLNVRIHVALPDLTPEELDGLRREGRVLRAAAQRN